MSICDGYDDLIKSPNVLVVEDVIWGFIFLKKDLLCWYQKVIVIDEVHRLISKYDSTFLLTGSSARKLKYGSSNLLAGRAWKSELFPLSWSEITDFDLERYLTRGGND